jgi:inner membrane transporter RhtA
VIGGTSLYAGAAIAVLLFSEISPPGVAWLRQVGAAAVLLAWRRPGSAAWQGRRLLRATLFGLTTALMNLAFYTAAAHLPLGTVVAIEFLGPVSVAAVGSRRPRDIAALLLVTAGVALIADVRWSGSPTGVLLALTAAVLWAAYIVLGKRVAQAGTGVDDLAVGFAIAAVLLSPLALLTAPAWHSPRLLALGLGVGVLSTAIPYALDQVVLRRLGQARFALLLALLPVTATIMGVLALHQIPTAVEATGILAVVAGVALRSRAGDEPAVEPA